MGIQNKAELSSHGNFRGRELAIDIMNYTLEILDPRLKIKNLVRIENDGILKVDGLDYKLDEIKDIYVIGAGKGSAFIAEALEDVLLNRKEFNNLKLVIKQAVSRKISEKKLREYILKSRIKMRDDLLRFFPFYAKLENDSQSNLPSDMLLKELQEKNAFLVQVAGHLDTIYQGLKDK